MAVFPASVDKSFDAISLWEDGTVIIGASCLSGKYWSGSVWCFKDLTDIPKMEKCITAVETEAGVCDIVSLGQDKIMLGLDSGSVEIMHLEQDPVILNSVFYASEHDDLVSSIDILEDKTKAVTGSYDYSIKVWDLEALVSCATFRPAHGNIVLQVSPCKSNPNLFLSCSMDLRLRLWDVRAGNKACIVSTSQAAYSSKCVVPTAIGCQPGSYLYAVGYENGDIKLGDLRNASNPTEELSFPTLVPTMGKINCHQDSIRKLEFCPERPEWLASCADSTEVIVTSVSNPAEPVDIYKNVSHENYVRDLFWDLKKNCTLLSCGWNATTHSHNIITNNSSMDTEEQ